MNDYMVQVKFLKPSRRCRTIVDEVSRQKLSITNSNHVFKDPDTPQRKIVLPEIVENIRGICQLSVHSSQKYRENSKV